MIALQIAWVFPQFDPVDSAPPPVGAARIRLFDANVSQTNRDLTEMAQEIQAERPQVLMLEELTPAALKSLQRNSVLSRFPYSLVRTEEGAGGEGLWSTVPLIHYLAWTDLGFQYEIQAQISIEDRVLTLNVAHVFAPVGSNQPVLWKAQLSRLLVHYESESGMVLVAGDFNATGDHPQFQQFLRHGFSDAAVLAGEGWRMTWPRNQAWVIPYLRIDHVLLSKGLTETSYRLGNGKGSDHHPLLVTWRWTRPLQPDEDDAAALSVSAATQS